MVAVFVAHAGNAAAHRVMVVILALPDMLPVSPHASVLTIVLNSGHGLSVTMVAVTHLAPSKISSLLSKTSSFVLSIVSPLPLSKAPNIV